MIKDVKTKILKVIPDERGRLMEILRNDDEIYIKFGQIYMTSTYPGVVKGWHLHRKQIDNILCVKGMLKLVLYDDRDGSLTKGKINEFFIGEYNPMLVQIPNGIYHGWKCISETEAIVINCTTEIYNYTEPDQIELLPHNSRIPYDWTIKEK